jgi:hypothetical protein
MIRVRDLGVFESLLEILNHDHHASVASNGEQATSHDGVIFSEFLATIAAEPGYVGRRLWLGRLNEHLGGG